MDIELHTDQIHIRTCAHCHARYDWRRSASAWLKMTYCGSLCEAADLGFTIDALFQVERQTTRPQVKELVGISA